MHFSEFEGGVCHESRRMFVLVWLNSNRVCASVCVMSTDSLQYVHTPRLFNMASTSSVFDVTEILNPARSEDDDICTLMPFLQEDLYSASQPGLLPSYILLCFMSVLIFTFCLCFFFTTTFQDGQLQSLVAETMHSVSCSPLLRMYCGLSVCLFITSVSPAKTN